MEPLGSDIDPYDNDPGRWGHSMVNLAEILIPCLDAAGARSVVEVGAYAGDLTRALVEWADTADGRVWAIDPSPHERLVALADNSPRLELVREPSLDALGHVPMPDAVVIDGDHNYYTVSEELRIIFDRTSSDQLPLLLFHDVCWPHARRDDYFAHDQIPAEWRQPIIDGGGLFPGVAGTRPGGLPYKSAAAREGGAHNGVLTAVEDFTAAHDGLRLAVVSAFFGLGVVWLESAPWAEALTRVLEPWDRHPLLERLEANRVLHLAAGHLHMTQAAETQGRNQGLEAMLQRLLDSSAFALAERLSRLRLRARVGTEHAPISKAAVRRLLEDRPAPEPQEPARGESRPPLTLPAVKARGELVADGVQRLRRRVRGAGGPPPPGWLQIPRSAALGGWSKIPNLERGYEALLAPLRDERFALLELGVATGDSMVMWRDGFPNATIVGVDRDLPDIDLGPRVNLAKGDQSDRELLSSLRRSHAPDGFKVIVDDASHLGAVTARSIQALFVDHLQPGGLYIIEDWETGYYPSSAWPDGADYATELDISTVDAVAQGTDGTSRMPSHDHGMVGLAKRLIDHVAGADIRNTTPAAVGQALPIESMTVRKGMVVLRRAEAAEE